jgi:hypothetical protein
MPIDIEQKIRSIEQELDGLKDRERNAVAAEDKEREHDLQQRITAKENQLTEFVKLLQKSGILYVSMFPLNSLLILFTIILVG